MTKINYTIILKKFNLNKNISSYISLFKKFNEKKIIFFCPSIEEGGVEKNLFLMVKTNFSEKFKTTIVTANYNKKIMFDKKVKFISTNKYDIGNLPRIIKSIFCSLLLIKIYFKDRNNILISYESNIFAIILAKILI